MKKHKPSESQSERFKVAAKDLGCYESEEAFNANLKKVANAKPEPRKDQGKESGTKK